MESSDLSNIYSMVQMFLTYLPESLFYEYLKRIFVPLTCKISAEGNKRLIDFGTFQSFINLPIFISENLFKLCKKENKSQYITLDTFYDILKKTFIYSSSDDDTQSKVEFFLNFFTELSGSNDLYANDFKLVFYHFHMISNKSKKHIFTIDTIVNNFFGAKASVDKLCKMNKVDFEKKIKENSDLFYLFYFYLTTYRPFDQEEIKEILDNFFHIKDVSNTLILSQSVVSFNFLNLASPSNYLFEYLNSEFDMSLFFYNDLDNDLKELDDFMSDVVNVKKKSSGTVKAQIFEQKYFLYSHHLFDLTTNSLYFLVGSFLEKPKDKNLKNVLDLSICNNTTISLNFQSLENTAMFYKKFGEFLRVPRMEDKYEIRQQISEGEYGQVKLCCLKERKTDESFVVKTVDKKKSKNFKWELYISKFLSKLDINGIARIYDIFETKDKAFIISEYVKNGSLNDFLFSSDDLLSAEQITIILQNILHAVNTLNRFGIIHRDIKPDNILITDNSLEVKFIDFGFSKVIGTVQKCDRNCGTICFAAPEILTKKQYTLKADNWSIGVIAYYLQFGDLPFDSEEDDVKKIIKQIVKIQYDLPDKEEIENYCEFAYEIITRFLKNEAERAEISEFIGK